MLSWRIESLSKAGYSSAGPTSEGSLNEDRWVARETVLGQIGILLAGVVDGAAPLVPPGNLPGEATAGALAAEAAREVVLNADLSQPLKSVLLQVNRRIRLVSLRYGADCAKPETLWAVAASLVRLSTSGRLEYAHIADTVVLLATARGGVLLSHNQVEPFDRIPLLKMQEARRKGILDPDEQVAFAMSEMIEEKALANAPDSAGYGALNGMEDHMVEVYIKEGEMNLDDKVKFIALLTDGMLPPPTRIGQARDWQQIVNILDSEGLPGLFLHTHHIENSDPWLECPRVKMHDDATGVLIRLQWDASPKARNRQL